MNNLDPQAVGEEFAKLRRNDQSTSAHELAQIAVHNVNVDHYHEWVQEKLFEQMDFTHGINESYNSSNGSKANGSFDRNGDLT